MKFRKKPVVIDAVQWIGTRESEAVLLRFMGTTDGPTGFVIGDVDGDGRYLQIETREGTMKARLGDWIIRGIQGEPYPCKPDIFELTYEAVEG